MEISKLCRGHHFKMDGNVYQKTDGVRWGDGSVEYCCVTIADGLRHWIAAEIEVVPVALIITLSE